MRAPRKLNTSRGGNDLTPKKDLPFPTQEKDLSLRKNRRKSLKVKVEGEQQGKEEKQQGEKDADETGKKIKEVESVLFIPATPGSGLKKPSPEGKLV